MRVQRKPLLVVSVPLLLIFAAAYIQWAVVGIPSLPLILPLANIPGVPNGFPVWLRITHYVNFLVIILPIRSGL